MNLEFSTGEYENLRIRIEFLKENFIDEFNKYLILSDSYPNLPSFNVGLHKEIFKLIDFYLYAINKGSDLIPDESQFKELESKIKEFIEDLKVKIESVTLNSPN